MQIGILVYLVLAVGSVEVNWARVYDGLERGQRFVMGFLQPDFTSRWRDISQGLVESLTMTLTSTVVGVAISIPSASARRATSRRRWIYYICRSIIAVSRACRRSSSRSSSWRCSASARFAGFLTLSFATIGFIAKLLADDIEEIDEAQAEAVRATGASWWQLVNYAVQPQVMPRLIGLSLYRLDINFRESAVIGIVGAGGIGATLNTAIDRYEYDSAGAILLIIIAIVMVAEYSSSYLRKFLQ
jgi:phosphonate transport system permease protein